ncbi:uncharacterized protein F54H12.2 [Nephila pilipes]|uniref:Uncharacterized protein F54H12.2 n=1 Tax=Nephila pilipes TaxID=299642 RepID=A0A8X6QI89_NEPPI|nr:uncharacterized protein F54H12.2 [Nephila pilipes]
MEKCYCTKNKLELFSPEKIQLAIDSSSFVEIHPIASISDSSTIEYQITGLGDAYFDSSHVFLNIQAKILKADVTAFTTADNCGPIYYLLKQCFRNVTSHSMIDKFLPRAIMLTKHIFRAYCFIQNHRKRTF